MLDPRAAWRQLLMDRQARLRRTCGTRLLNLASAACRVGDHRRVIFSVVYMLARCLLGCLMVRGRREASKDAELLALRHENAVPSRQVGRVRYRPGDRLWLAALSRLILDQMLIVSEHHLRRVLTEYLPHYNDARPHRSLGQLTPAQADTHPPEPGNLAEFRIRRKQVLGGLTHEYYAAA